MDFLSIASIAISCIVLAVKALRNALLVAFAYLASIWFVQADST